ncbi:hypothetical protein KAJ61_05275 [Candidatus Parcubacteria bacterium]|nr:hypothetical protein [Candidatus Parcubacteria bacterium]
MNKRIDIKYYVETGEINVKTVAEDEISLPVEHKNIILCDRKVLIPSAVNAQVFRMSGCSATVS